MWEADIQLVKEAIHPWRSTDDQYDKWVSLVRNLCELHNVPEASLIVVPGIGYPRYSTNKIVLDKYSIISLLHELGHHFGYSERKCVEYSEYVFLTAYPKTKLIRDSRNYLVRR